MKSLFVFAAMLCSGFVNAQAPTPMQQKKADFFAAEAITYFKLDESKKKGISDAKLGLLIAQKEMERKKKAGELPESEVDDYRKKNVYPFTQKILNIIDIKFKELNDFNMIVHPKMNQIKE